MSFPVSGIIVQYMSTAYKATKKLTQTRTLIGTTIKISIGLNELSLLLWHFTTFDIFLQIQRKCQC